MGLSCCRSKAKRPQIQRDFSDATTLTQEDLEKAEAGCCRKRVKASKPTVSFARAPRSLEEKFRQACAEGNVFAVRRILAGDMDVNCETSHGYTGLHAAAAHGHLAVVDALVQSDAFVEGTAHGGIAPLMLAVMGGHQGVVKALLEAKASASEKLEPVAGHGPARSVMELAQSFGHKQVADLLAEYLPKEDSTKKTKTKSRKNIYIYIYNIYNKNQ
eukprot:symbB.v1.2.024282.t1/scaffold2286.1/size83374/7